MTRTGALRAAGHVLAHLALLVGLLAVTELDVGWNLDDGAYAIQAKVLDHSDDWAYPYRHADIDPGSRFAPVSHSELTEEGSYPFVRYPAWEQVLRASRVVFGDVVGLYVPSVLGAVAAALAGGLLARRLRPGAFALGYWALALGPLVVHTQAMWAHTWMAALGGVVALALARSAAASERDATRVGLAAVGVVTVVAAGAALLRKDGLLLAAAASGAGGLTALTRPGPVLRQLVRAVPWGLPAVAGVGLALVNGRWVDRLAPGGTAPDGPGDVDTALVGVGYLDGRVRGALRSMVDGVGAASAGTALGLAAVALAVVAGVALASGPRRRTDGLVLAAGAVVLLLVRVAVAPADLAGLLTASPLVAVGVGAWRWSAASPAARAAGRFVATYLVLGLATQYPEGGARDWGGRYFFALLVPAVVLALVAVARALDLAPRPGRPAALLLAGLVAVPTVAGLLATRDLRANNEASTRAALDAGAPTVIRMPRYLTRVSWRVLPGPDWLSAADPAGAAEALARLRPGRTEPVAVLGPGADQVEADGYRREVRGPGLAVFTPA